MNLAFKIVIFFLCVNMGTGLMNIAIVDSNGDPVFSEASMRGGLFYNSNSTNAYSTGMSKTVNPSTGEIQDAGDASYRVLDMLGLGFIGRFLDVLNNFLYGFFNLLQIIFEPLLKGATGPIFAVLKGVLTIGYALGAWSLFTGKDIKE